MKIEDLIYQCHSIQEKLNKLQDIELAFKSMKQFGTIVEEQPPAFFGDRRSPGKFIVDLSWFESLNRVIERER